MEPGIPQTTSLPAADVVAPQSGAELVVHQAFPVRQPEEEHTEFLIRVRASTLGRIRKKVAQLTNSKFPWPEFWLGTSTLAIGAALGAIPANLEFRTAIGMFFYLILPVVGSSAMVAYGLQRRTSMIDASRIAQEVLDELPDPDKAR